MTVYNTSRIVDCQESQQFRPFRFDACQLTRSVPPRYGLWERVEPYATVGIGSFTGSTVAAADVGPTEFRQFRRDTHFASNLGAGLTYRFNRWLGVNADYRHFFVNAGDLQHVNRFATGVKLFVK